MNRERGVLVVGSAHLDVIADYSDGSVLDKPGIVQFSIGGSAYNIAVNLARHGNRTFLLTFLKRGSLVTPLVRAKLHAAGVRLKYVRTIGSLAEQGAVDAKLPASGFVAHRLNGEVVSAVTSCLMENLTFREGSPEAGMLSNALERCNVVVADANLSPRGLLAILQRAAAMKRSVVVSGVSERKIRNIVAIQSETLLASVVCANELEIAALDEEFSRVRGVARRGAAHEFLSDRTTPDYIGRLCQKLHARAIAVTHGEIGASIYFASGLKIELEPPLVDRVVSTTGAGDAFASALVAYLGEKDGHLEASASTAAALQNMVYAFVPPVLSQEAATPGASLDLNVEEQARAQAPLSRIAIFLRDSALQYGVSRVAETVIGVTLVAGGAAVITIAYRVLLAALALIKQHVR